MTGRIGTSEFGDGEKAVKMVRGGARGGLTEQPSTQDLREIYAQLETAATT